MAATLKKLDWKTIVPKLVAKKNRILTHYDRPELLKDVKFVKPLSLPGHD